MSKKVLLGLLLIAAFLIRLKFDLPITFSEARAVYASQVPLIYLLGITDVAVRLPGVIFGMASIILFYLLSRSLVATVLFAFSPLLIQTNIMDTPTSLTLFAILLAAYLWVKKKILLSRLLVVVIIAIILLSQQNILSNLKPANYTYLIGLRFNLDKTFGQEYPLYTYKLNRLALNKGFYGLNQLMTDVLAPFNYEQVSAPLQAQALLGTDYYKINALPKIFFWEIPLILFGLVIYFRQIPGVFKIILFSGLFCAIFFKSHQLTLALPAFALAEGLFLSHLWASLKKFQLYVGGVAIIFYLLAMADFTNQLWFHPEEWFNQKELLQQKIWQTLTDQQIKDNKIFVTDRLGEPAYYYLYYHKVNPQTFQQTSKLGTTLDDGSQRVDSVGNVSFGSFKFFEAPRASDQIWVGLSGEFLGQYKATRSDEVLISDGTVIKKIPFVEMDSNFFGDEVWFVKTDLSERTNENSHP